MIRQRVDGDDDERLSRLDIRVEERHEYLGLDGVLNAGVLVFERAGDVHGEGELEGEFVLAHGECEWRIPIARHKPGRVEVVNRLIPGHYGS